MSVPNDFRQILSEYELGAFRQLKAQLAQIDADTGLAMEDYFTKLLAAPEERTDGYAHPAVEILKLMETAEESLFMGMASASRTRLEHVKNRLC